MTLESLAGRRAVVTGGGTGVGRAVALALAREGCRVAVAGRREEKLEETVSLHRGGTALLAVPCDVADRCQVAALFRQVREAFGGVDILVQSAGANIRHRSLAEIDPEDWDRLLRINATGAFDCLREVLPEMRARGAGEVVNISSIAGKRAALLGGVAYNASKFAMTALGTSAALEAGHDGVRVTNIYPGEIDTPILDDRPEPVSQERRARMLKAEDVAETVLLAVRLPPHAHVAELVIKPVTQDYA